VLATGAIKEFDVVLVSSTTPQPEFDFQIYLKDLGGAFPDKQILYFSSFLSNGQEEPSPRHFRLHSLHDLGDFIASI
jgi:hypothetical protein